MAANDPAPDVPTATGTLQGVAPFYYNGSAWTSTNPAEGSASDAAWVSGSGSIVALLKATVNALNAALPAGTNAIGTVSAGGFTAAVQVAPTVQAAAYAAGTCIGGLLTFANAARVAAGSGMALGAACTFASGIVPSLDLILFNASPGGGTITDRSALAIATADLAKVVGVIHLTDSAMLGAASPSLMQGQAAAVPFKLGAGQSLYGALVMRSTTATLGSTTDATVTLFVAQD